MRASSPPGAAGDAAASEVLRELVRRGLAEAEVLTKRGRSRRLALELGSETSTLTVLAVSLSSGTRKATAV